MFGGSTYNPALDHERLSTQLEKVKAAVTGGEWWTLSELSMLCDGSEASISARLRDLRKPQFGGYSIERYRVNGGLFKYRMAPA
jgi:hypothetical protein